MKIQKKNSGGGQVGGIGLGGQVGCDRRIEVLVKILKDVVGQFGGRGRGGLGGVRVDVNEELKFL